MCSSDLHESNDLFNSNEISICKNACIKIKHFNEDNHKVRQKKSHIKKIRKSEKLKIKIPKKLPSTKNSKKHKKSKKNNSYNDYGKTNKEQITINLKENCFIGEDMNTSPESPEKKAQFKLENYINIDKGNDPKLEKDSINKGTEVNANINIDEEEDIMPAKVLKVDEYIVSSENKNGFNCSNKENSFSKKNSSGEQKNSIRKKISFSSQEIEDANINNKEKKEGCPDPNFIILSENSILESDELPVHDKENNFNLRQDYLNSKINIDEIDNLIPQNLNDSNEYINLCLIEDIKCNYRNKKNS